jgi:amino-acid N-acetyltransferase
MTGRGTNAAHRAFAIRDAVDADAVAISALVRAAGLPLDGIDRPRFAVADQEGRVIGCAGLEVHGSAALLRSVAVDPEWRGHGIGEALVRAILDSAAECALDPVVLLTTTAPEWFLRFGFEIARRQSIPGALLDSAEFRGACPDTAVVMKRTVRSEP